MPKHKNLWQFGYKIYTFGRPFQGHHYYLLYSVCLIYAEQ